MDLVVERGRLGGPGPSRLELGLRNQVLEIDKHIAMMHIEEYRKLLGACFGGGILAGESLINIGIGRLPEHSPAGPPGRSYPALLPAPAPGSSSQALVAQPAALLGGPPVAVEVRQPDAVLSSVPAVPGPCAPTSSRPATPSSLTRLNSGGVSGRARGRGHGQGRGRGRTDYQNVATWPTQPRLVCNSSCLGFAGPA